MTKGPKPYVFLDEGGKKRFAKTKISFENSGKHRPVIFVKYLSSFKKWMHIELVYNEEAPYAKHLNKLSEIDESTYDCEVQRLIARAIVEYAGRAFNWSSEEKERNYSHLLEST